MTQYRRRRIGKLENLRIAHWHRCPLCGLTRRVMDAGCVGYHGEPLECAEFCAGCGTEAPVA